MVLSDKVFSVNTDTVRLERRLEKELGNDLPFITAKSLTQTVGKIQELTKRQIERRFDRPTRYTIRSTFVSPATKRKLEANVYFKDKSPRGQAAGKYLKPTILGTSRRHKGFERRLIAKGIMDKNEYAVPGDDVKLNKFGNLSNGVIQRILSNLSAQSDKDQNTTEDSKARKRKRKRMFVPARGSVLPRGVYQDADKRDDDPTLILLFVTNRPDYQKILPFRRIASRTARVFFPPIFRRNANEQIIKNAGTDIPF